MLRYTARCHHCKLGISGRRRSFCDRRCRQRAWRRRRQGLPEDAYSWPFPGGERAQRGPVPMWRMTRSEQRDFDRLYGD